MPRNMSFALTTQQILDQSKTVTRRLGWDNLKAGDLFWAVEKIRGLKRGEKVKRLALLRCVSNRSVRLCDIDLDEVNREGFAEMMPQEFVAFFCRKMRVCPTVLLNRIEFDHVRCSFRGTDNKVYELPRAWLEHAELPRAYTAK